MDRFRTAALQQAMRATRRSAALISVQATPLIRDVYLLLEALAADEELARRLPGRKVHVEQNDIDARVIFVERIERRLPRAHGDRLESVFDQQTSRQGSEPCFVVADQRYC